MRTLAATLLAFIALISAGCGGSSSSSAAAGPLSGNWQLNLNQNYPTPQTQLSASGFFLGSSNALTGSVQGPTVASSNGNVCGGVGQLSGTIDGQNVTFSVSPGWTVFNFIGVISSDNTSMSGTYQALAGTCFGVPTTGTWTASLVPPVNGNFSGTLLNSQYIGLLTGISPPPPVTVSGTMNQSGNFGASNATVTGTITAQGYPCFVTVSLTGTISGQSLNLAVFGFDGSQIGVFQATPTVGPTGSVVINSGSLTLGQASSTGNIGPCPPLANGGSTLVGDTTEPSFVFQ